MLGNRRCTSECSPPQVDRISARLRRGRRHRPQSPRRAERGSAQVESALPLPVSSQTRILAATDDQTEFVPASLAVRVGQPLACAMRLKPDRVDQHVFRFATRVDARLRRGECRPGCAVQSVVWSGTPTSDHPIPYYAFDRFRQQTAIQARNCRSGYRGTGRPVCALSQQRSKCTTS